MAANSGVVPSPVAGKVCVVTGGPKGCCLYQWSFFFSQDVFPHFFLLFGGHSFCVGWMKLQQVFKWNTMGFTSRSIAKKSHLGNNPAAWFIYLEVPFQGSFVCNIRSGNSIWTLRWELSMEEANWNFQSQVVVRAPTRPQAIPHVCHGKSFRHSCLEPW